VEANLSLPQFQVEPARGLASAETLGLSSKEYFGIGNTEGGFCYFESG
jgi:hypothetical protein